MIVTVDVEADFGGRTDTLQGIEEGVPWLLGELSARGIQATFFLSTRYLEAYLHVARDIKDAGHVIGSHGHQHKRWRSWLPWRLDYMKARDILKEQLGVKSPPYRAPKFSFTHPEHRYSDPKGHTSILQHMWLGKRFQEILYCHPFDFVEPKTNAPNWLCEVLYSRPQKARDVLLDTLKSCKE